ncbi:MAG: hypothetical protein J1E05_00435 [Eubacterium sp.]|nr:hypothetical protein [Eubacterium sp.]
MANCPNCGVKIPFWNIKAECSKCGVSIPNFNWMERLEEDNKNAERAFGTFYKTLNRVKYSLFGTKLRIARIVLTFIQVIAFILPWSIIKAGSTGAGFDLALISLSGNKGILDIISQLTGNSSLIFANMGFEAYSGPVTFMFIATVLYLLSLIFIVIAFFMTIIKCAKPKTKSSVIYESLAIIVSLASMIIFSIAASLGNDFTAFSFGAISAINVSGGFAWGYIVAVVLFLVALGINVAVAVAPAKSDEELEAERKAKADAKEQKAKEDAERKAKAREEAAKAAAEEQKRVVEEAKRKLAEHDAKEKEKAEKHKK